MDENTWSLGGELEIYVSQRVYNINVCAYKPCLIMGIKKLEYTYIWNYMQDNNYYKDLCILINENYSHWNIIIHNSELII